MAKHHVHRHAHPHPKSKHHHHAHLKHKGRPSELAHHHPIGPLQGRPAPPTSGTRGVKRLWRNIYSWFPHAVSLGVFNCRRIAGSSSWSQHAFGDALDIASPSSVKSGRPDDYLDAIVEFVHKVIPDQDGGRVIYRDSAHQNHAHCDWPPDRGGTPPCAK
jgi:hypothetical protein